VSNNDQSRQTQEDSMERFRHKDGTEFFGVSRFNATPGESARVMQIWPSLYQPAKTPGKIRCAGDSVQEDAECGPGWIISATGHWMSDEGARQFWVREHPGRKAKCGHEGGVLSPTTNASS
jgi:hypothetical protein